MLQAIKTEPKGSFQFTLDEGFQSDMEINASNPDSWGSHTLTGCQVQVSVSGYQPLTRVITPGGVSLGSLDIGALQLQRIAGVQGSAVSVTSVQAPPGARKEFEKGDAEARASHLKPATQHLEKAVAEFEKYAAAWNELGMVYSSNQETENARRAFEKAIAADPNYVPPYLNLAALQLGGHEYEKALATAGKAVELDSTIATANFIRAVANFNLNQLDAAEKSAREAAKGPHENIPQLHVLLADILVQKRDYSNAEAELRAYLKEAPQGQFAGQVQEKLEQTEKLAASAASESAAVGKEPRLAPHPVPLVESGRPEEEQALVEAPSAKILTSSGVDRTGTDLWLPPDIDKDIPQVSQGTSCPLSEVLSEAGKRVEELVQNVDKFTATEIVEHQDVDRTGRLGASEIRKFSYLVTIAQGANGSMSVEEYRNLGSAPDQFPDHIATTGTPALVLIFHPQYAKDFQMMCEGLGEWRGQPAWQVRFEERLDRRNSIMDLQIDSSSYSPRLRGRAWIVADSYQVARLESDLVEEIPQIRLRLQHQDIEYSPVPFGETKDEIWLPSSTEMYMDFLGHRFFRRHTFTDIKLFSVGLQQTFGDPQKSRSQSQGAPR
jgi:tetratricopeptide (TPR) repeat protein